jgi:hypothetical protein
MRTSATRNRAAFPDVCGRPYLTVLTKTLFMHDCLLSIVLGFLVPSSVEYLNKFLCCIVMSACPVLLFYRNHFIDMYCHLFIPTRVILEFVTQVKGIVLRILYTPACRDHRAAWGAEVKYLRRLVIVRPDSWRWIFCTLDVHGSVHHNVNRIEITNKMRPCGRIYYSSLS